MIRGVRRGCVRLKGAIIGIDDEDNTTFTITVDGKTFHFQARNFDEREKWVRCLEDTIVRHAYGCHSSSSSMQYDHLKSLPTINNFDKKVTEADAYLQLLIDQVKELESKTNNAEAEEKETCERIISDTNNMLEQVKHTIVLLQIAKNSAFPVNGTYQPQMQNSDPYDESCIRDSKHEIEEGSEISEKEMLPVFRPLPVSTGYMADVPDVSYSTSEDEDFYDACDDECTANSETEEFSSIYQSQRFGRFIVPVSSQEPVTGNKITRSLRGPGKFVGAMSGQHWSFCAAAVETNEKEKNMNLNVTEDEGECEYAITHEFLVRASWSWIVVFLLPAPTGLMSVLSFRVPFLREGDALVIDKCVFHADS
ncbi:hypothetical protein V9T40_004116 [Parthenolecanium corni]|uniref:PH domain-containing protein n=1 Tax=Parthenolecanium corni TaxID=536013 RepID=A0AAN9TIR4_9HEMI